MGETLEALHKRGILHGGLQPAKVPVTASGAKLLDFGLAQMTVQSDIDSTRTTEGRCSAPRHSCPPSSREAGL